MSVQLTLSDYSYISKLAKIVKINYRNPNRDAIAHLDVDAAELKVYG